MSFSIKYFISKFEAIPEDKWCVGDYYKEGSACALGHLGKRSKRSDGTSRFDPTCESLALQSILGSQEAHKINDGLNGFASLGTTPKQRILNALYSKLREGMAIK